MKKKFLALVLTLAMVLSLAPVGALAVDGGAQDTPANDVITYQAGTPKENYPDGLTTLNKQAEKIPDTDNQYKVTLTVGMSQKKETVVTSQEAATVLVIDISNSMGCTKEEHKHTDRCYETEKIKCTPDSKPDHWVSDKDFWGKEYLRHKDEKDNFQSECKYNYWYQGYYYDGETKLICRKEEHSYNDNCHTRLTDAKAAARAFVETYAGSVQDAGRKLAIVLFNCDASVELSWTDASTDKATVLAAIDGISLGEKDDGSTNLEQGLSKAKELLSDSSLNDISKANKNIIALTDGAPTHAKDASNRIGKGTSGSAKINKATFTTATAVKTVANLYTVCFGAENTKTYSGGPTVGKFLEKSIATDSNHAYNADNADKLNNVFKEISQNITSGLSAGTVHDALPDGVSSSDADFTADWNLSGEGGFTCDKTTDEETGRTDYTYTKTYTVTIDPDKIDTSKLENGYYPLNDRTTLTVKTGDANTVLDFPIPAGKVTAKITYVLDGGENAASNPETYVCGVGVDNFADATKSGYSFGGWYSDASFETKVENIGPTETGDKTLYAKWEAQSYNIDYVLDGGTNADTNPGTYIYGVGVSSFADATKSGYSFGGWYSDASFETKVENIGPTETGDKTLYAKWEQITPSVTDTYTLTIKYVYEDGKEAATTYTQQLNQDDTYKVESPKISGYVASMITVKGTMPAQNTKVTVTYYLDNWKDADNTTDEQDKDSETGGDGIPDCDQVLIKYVSSNSDRGTVSPDMEVLTIRKANEKVVPTANGSTATDKGGRNYFSNWTDKDNTQVSTNATLNNETIQKVIKEFTGGETYTFTANFGRSSGGSGGSSRPTVTIPDDVPTGLNGKDHYAYVVGYPDGMVYPQKNITRAEVATIFFRLLTDETREANMTKSNSYNDMKDGAWYTCAVSTLSKMGIIKGYEDGSFKPDASISRAEFAAIAARFDPDGDKTPATFSDVSSHWAKDEISIAANHGWIKGYEDGSFKPDQKITRAETMTLVNRVLKRLPETKDDLHKDMKTWPDNQNESAWFYLAVQEATNSHYQKLKKDGTHETWESMRETRDWAALEK